MIIKFGNNMKTISLPLEEYKNLEYYKNSYKANTLYLLIQNKDCWSVNGLQFDTYCSFQRFYQIDLINGLPRFTDIVKDEVSLIGIEYEKRVKEYIDDKYKRLSWISKLCIKIFG